MRALSRPVVLLAALWLAACGSKQTTGEVLTAVGVAAVAVAAGAEFDDFQQGGCVEVKGSLPGDKEVHCHNESDSKVERAVLAGAGLGLAAVGAELQRSAFDDATSSAVRTRPTLKQKPRSSPAACTPSAPTSVVFLPPAQQGAAGAGTDSEPSCTDPSAR